MKLTGITTETEYENEARLIALLLDNGLHEMHIRKPGYSSEQLVGLLQQIPATYHSHLILHDHFELAERFGVGGLHLNHRTPVAPAGYAGRTGRSCHTFEEVQQSADVDYCFLSPIYDSLSKSGYRSRFTEAELRRAAQEGIIGERVYALGGVEPRHLPQLRALGFGGAVLLGYLWNGLNEQNAKERMAALHAANTI